MLKEPFGRIDSDPELRNRLMPYCRLKKGEVWEDPVRGHRVGCLDATNEEEIKTLMKGERAGAANQDPPYNVVVGNLNTGHLGKTDTSKYIEWCKSWVRLTAQYLLDHSHFYVWIGADQNDGFQPLPDFMMMMRAFSEFRTRSFITMRNQRGYGTQKNWMAVRQELLYYIKGNPDFNVEAEYTDIPKILRGYYKKVNGRVTENLERSNSEKIRAGNVWVDIQQVFYRLEENIPGCYTQKPLKAIQRIVKASQSQDASIIDFFSHSGTTLLATEIENRKCYTCEIDPIFVELTIRRLEHYRKTGEIGWQVKNPFPEVRFDYSRTSEKSLDIVISGAQQSLF